MLCSFCTGVSTNLAKERMNETLQRLRHNKHKEKDRRLSMGVASQSGGSLHQTNNFNQVALTCNELLYLNELIYNKFLFV